MSKPSSLDRAAGDLDAGHPPESSSDADQGPPLADSVDRPASPDDGPAPSPFFAGPPSPSEGTGASHCHAGAARSPSKPSYLFLGVVSLITLAADLSSKRWAEHALQGPGQIPTPRPVIKGVMGFMLAHNKGGAWGLLQGSAENFRKYFFLVVSAMAILFIVSLYRRLHPGQSALKWGLPLVLGGALGNLVDRIRFGSVVDFIDCQLKWSGTAHHWPTFNVADIAICVGVGLMALDMLSGRKHDEPRAAPISLGPGADLAPTGSQTPPPGLG